MKKREGRFKAAEGGTLLLDEVADIPLLAQSKLLRVLEENTYEPLGTNQTATADVRILSATHRNLKEMVAKHLFREDLYYRLKILEIQVPALRERGGDLLLLLEHLLRKFTQPSSPPWVTARALAALAQYPFPGNVRELSHAIQHAVIVSEGRQVDLEHLPSEIAGTEAAKHGPGSTQLRSLSEAVREFEREYVRRAVQQTKGRRTEAADLLGISRKSLWERLRGYGISDSDLESPKESDGPANGKAGDPTEG